VPAGLSKVVAIAAGGSDYGGFSLALEANGTVVGWGDNTYGQTTVPAGLTNAVAVAAGSDFSLALQANGTVVGWGYNYDGSTDVPSGLSNVVAIAAGGSFSLALVGGGGTPLSQHPIAFWQGVNADLHGIEPIGWRTWGFVPTAFTVQILAARDGLTYPVGSSTNLTGSLNWNTTAVPDGVYQLQALFSTNSVQIVTELNRTVLVNNSVIWHSGVVTTNETWMAGTVHVVEGNLQIASGVTVTIQAGAVVKFAPGAAITVASGAVLDASAATPNAPIVFTSLADDTVGGDTSLDGGNPPPEPGDWSGIAVQGTGQFILNANVEIEYIVHALGGTLAGNQTLLGSFVYIVTNNVVVPSGVTLTINPGAVLKFMSGAGISVQAGGMLRAPGTVAQPITFTSINDDSVGGDSNGGATTAPAPGDWVGINNSGTVSLNHCTISYGGDTGSGVEASGVIIVNGGVLNVSNSVVESTMWDGISVSSGSGTIVNSVLRNTDRAIWAYPNGNISLINCTFDNNLIGVDQHYNSGEISAENCLIADSLQIGVQFEGGPQVSLQYCDVWSSITNGYVNYSGLADQTGFNGNISADPKFINEAQGNYQLNYGSPCIDAANSLVAPPTDIMGDPRYNDPRTLVKTGVHVCVGTNCVYADIGAYEFVENAVSPIDLVVSTVVGPATVTAGDNVTVSWTDANVGTASATGPWHDTITLVSMTDTSQVLAVADELVAQGVVLGPGQSYTNSATVLVPGGTEGNYQWQVQVNSQGDVFEGANWTNNWTLSAAPTSLTVPALIVGGAAVTNQFTAAGQTGVFKITPAAGTSPLLSVQGSTPGCALVLYVGAGYVPSPSHFDLKSSQFDSPSPSLLLANASGGLYYVTVYAQSLDAAMVSYSLAAAVPTLFTVDSASPGDIADNGPVTLQILGSLLGLNDVYQLVGTGGVFSANAVTLAGPTTAYATFNLAGAAAGNYNLQVTQPSGPTVTISNITVEPVAASPQLSIQLQLPSMYRIGRPFDGTVVYGNVGNADMPAPILIITTADTAGLRLFSTDSFSTSDLLLIGASMQGPAGILRPGQMWSIPFSALDSAGITIPFAVDYKTAAATDPIDYTSLAAQIRPAGYSDADWTALWNNFQAAAGPTWGGFVKLMGHYATIMAQETDSGEDVGTFYSLPDVLAYALADNLAQAQTSVAGTLYLSDTNHPLAETYVYLSNADDSQFGADQSSADGTFRILNLSNDTYTVAVAGYWLPNPVSITVTTNGPVTGLAIVVQPGGTINGVVQSQDGTAFLTNVTIIATSATTSGVYTVTSGADGSYVLSGLAPDIYNLTVGGGPYETQYLLGLTVSDGQVLSTNIYLAAGASVTGQVIGNSLAISNALVQLTDASSNQTSAVTDTNGFFSVTGLSAGSYSMVVQAPGFVSYSNQMTLSAGMSDNVGQIVMTYGATLDIGLQDGSQQPISNGVVFLLQNDVLLQQQFTDTNGIAAFIGVPSGTYVLVEEAYGSQVTSNTITVNSGTLLATNYVLTTLGSISGQVTDGNSQPISEIDVNVYGLGTNNQLTTFTVQTDTNGNYALLGLPSGPYLVTVGNDGGIEGNQTTIDSSLTPQTLNFVLTDSLLQGLVLGSDALTPLSGANVYMSQGSQLVATATTDTNGLYRFRVVLPGTYTIAAGATAAGLTSNQTVTVTAGTNLIAATLQTGNLQLSGTVTDSGNNGLSNAVVLVSRSDGPQAPADFLVTTASNGQFAVNGLAPGSYYVAISQSGFASTIQSLNLAGSTNQVFQLAPGTTVNGTIADAVSSLGISNAVVTFVDPATHFPLAITLTDSNGNYTAQVRSSGQHNVLISESQHQIAVLLGVQFTSNPFIMNAALSTTNTLLQGVVADSTENPIANAEVSIVDTNTGETLVVVQTANDGVWSTTQLPPGGYSISVRAVGYLAPPSRISLIAGAKQVINSVATPVATDDIWGSIWNTWNTVANSTYSFFKSISQDIGQFMLEFNGIFQPEFYPCEAADPPSPCACMTNPYNVYLAATNTVGQAFSEWQDTYNAAAGVAGAQAPIAVIESIQATANLLISFTPWGKAATALEKWQALSAAQKNAVFVLQGVTSGTALIGEEQTLIDQCRRMTALSWIDQLKLVVNAGNSFNIVDLTEAHEQLFNNQDALKWMPGVEAVFNILDVGIEWYETWKDWHEVVSTIHDREVEYDRDRDAATDAWIAYLHAEWWCWLNDPTCQGQPGNPPIPNPTPGPTDPLPVGTSRDPNDKSSTGVGGAGFVTPSEPIVYTIDFANETNATLPVQTVTITDQLDTNLNWSTLQLSSIGFNNVTIPVPAGVQSFSTNVNVATDPNPVQVTASLNATNGVLTWYMQSIDPVTGKLVTDPLAGFLPPDTTNGIGEGYVTYTIQAKSGLANGTVITNQANIVFDVNAPILTPVVTNTIDTVAPQSTVQPLPTTESNPQFTVQWGGTDTNGSGVQSYTVFVSTNGSVYVPWLVGTTNTSGIFTGQVGSTYAFYSVAVDDVGNIQPTPAVPEATTTVSGNAPAANFTASPTNGVTPLLVTFTDTSTGTITNRFWNFGDGGTTNTVSTNVVYQYTVAGTNTVTLIVSGPDGISTNTQSNLIAVVTLTAGNNGPVCAGSTLDLTASTVGGATYSWTGPNAFTSSQQNPAIANATPAASGVYNVTVTVNDTTSAPSTTTTIVNPASVGGTATPAAATVCSGSGTTITLAGQTGSIVKWQSSPDNSTWSDISSTANPYSTGNLTATTYFRAVVQSGTCPAAYSTSTQVAVNPSSVGGTATSTASTVCSGSGTTITLAGQTGSIVKWQSSPDNSTWSDISSTVNPYSTGNLTATTYFRAVVQSGTCSAAYSTSAQVTVNPASVGGTATPAAATVSSDRGTTITLAGQTGSIVKWQSSPNNSTWSDIASTANPYSTGNLTATTYFRAVVQSGTCPVAYSTSAQVSILSSLPPVITAGPRVTNAFLEVGNDTVLVAGETNVFAVTATDPSGLPLGYQWQFGDGVTNPVSALPIAEHVYDVSNCGPYTASVTVSNGFAATSSNLTVSVACELNVSELQLTSVFKHLSNDTCTVIATLDLGADFKPRGKALTVDVGGALCRFTLDKYGFGASDAGECWLTYLQPMWTKAGCWTLFAILQHGDWYNEWAEYGMVNATIERPGRSVTVPVVVLVGNEAFAAEQPLEYTATAGQIGTAQQGRPSQGRM
jgi:PKD repeat protein